MAKESYAAAELDETTRDYLTQVRKSAGQGMAGIFMSSGSFGPTWGFPLAGAVIVGVVMYLVIPPLNNPTHQAMLLTAGLLMGGWLIVAGIRILVAIARGHNLGTFTYADPRQLWIIDNSIVQRWPLDTLQSATLVDAKVISLEYPDSVEKVSIPFEVGVLEIGAYLNHWLSVRGDGPHDQSLIERHATEARAAAYNQMPLEQPAFSADIPVPTRNPNYRARHDWSILLSLAVFSVALYFAVEWLVLGWHDEAVFDFVRNRGPVYWRAYLLDERNTRHREEIKKMLRDVYQQKADQLKQHILDKNEPGFKGSDEAMAQLLMALVETPQPIVTLRVQDLSAEKDRPRRLVFNPILRANAPSLESRAQTEITDSLYAALGQDLISLAQPLEEVTALMDIRFKFLTANDQTRIEWSVAIRKSPDAEPHFKTAWTTSVLQAFQEDETFSTDLQRTKNALTGGAQ